MSELIKVEGQWLDFQGGKMLGKGWNKNLVVTNAKKVIAAGVGNMPSAKATREVALTYATATGLLTKTGSATHFVDTGYTSEHSVRDLFIYGADGGVNSSALGNAYKISAAASDGASITIDSGLGSNVTADVYGWIMKSTPMYHNLYMALGYGSSSWDSEQPNPNASATSLTNEYYRKKVSSVSHMQEYTGTLDSVASTTVFTDTDFLANFGDDCIGQFVEIIDGPAAGEARLINAFNSGTSTITVGTAFTTLPTTASVWRIAVPRLQPTGTIDITTTFNEEEKGANGVIREVGLFGANATQEIGSGELMNLFHHEAITKTTGSNQSITRTCRLRFTIA